MPVPQLPFLARLYELLAASHGLEHRGVWVVSLVLVVNN